MKINLVVFADFAEDAWGGPSQLLTPLAGQPLLRHTLRRLQRVTGVAQRALYVRPRDADVAARFLADAGLSEAFTLLAEDQGHRLRQNLARAARRWCPTAWRGNPLGLSWYDEFIDPLTIAQVFKRLPDDGLFCFDGAMPLVDPQLADEMLRHLREHTSEHKDECAHVFTQAPPGLTGVILRPPAIEQLLQWDCPYGLLLSYRPEIAQYDPITSTCCYHVPMQVAQTAARFTGDTRTSRELLTAAIETHGPDVDAEALCAWAARKLAEPGTLPEEVELELTTCDPLPESRLRPRGTRVPSRVLQDLGAVERLAAELATYDDRRVYLGGFGDPLLHPELPRIVRIFAEAGVRTLAAATPLVELSPDVFETLFDPGVTVLEVLLDAFTAETYQVVHGRDALPLVLTNLQRLEEARATRLSAVPLLVPNQTRCAATFHELEVFHDFWIQKVGSATVRGHSTFGGLVEPDTLLPITPAAREPCRRLTRRLTLLADGTTTLCDQDAAGAQAVGNWLKRPIAEIWQSASTNAARAAHDDLDLAGLPTCRGCDQWFRP